MRGTSYRHGYRKSARLLTLTAAMNNDQCAAPKYQRCALGGRRSERRWLQPVHISLHDMPFMACACGERLQNMGITLFPRSLQVLASHTPINECQ